MNPVDKNDTYMKWSTWCCLNCSTKLWNPTYVNWLLVCGLQHKSARNRMHFSNLGFGFWTIVAGSSFCGSTCCWVLLWSSSKMCVMVKGMVSSSCWRDGGCCCSIWQKVGGFLENHQRWGSQLLSLDQEVSTKPAHHNPYSHCKPWIPFLLCLQMHTKISLVPCVLAAMTHKNATHLWLLFSICELSCQLIRLSTNQQWCSSTKRQGDDLWVNLREPHVCVLLWAPNASKLW